MKVDLRDRDALLAMRPLEVAGYLRSQGWREHGKPNESWTSFVRDDYEIALPLTSNFRDFSSRMAEALRTLEIAENRDQLQILSDLSAVSSDIVRIKVSDPDSRDGTLPLERAVEIVENAQNMMMAAACAAVDPKLYYPSRKPSLATDYMRRVRMGQTERGSFIVTVLSRVTPELIPTVQAKTLGIPEPFERRVTLKLHDAISAATAAATNAIASGSIDEFEAAVPQGVSANFCSAISALGATDDSAREVSIDMTWARVRETSARPAARFLLPPDFAPVFQEAAKFLKTKAPIDEFEVRGPVFRLVRDPPEAEEGEVTIAGLVDGVTRNIWVQLRGEDYRLAVEAHKQHLYVSAVGILRKEGRSWRLAEPRRLRMLAEDDE